MDYNVAMTETQVQVDSITIHLVSMEAEQVTLMHVWDWLHEFPHNNFDDFGPTLYGEFLSDLARRHYRGEKIWIADVLSQPVGIIGYAPLNSYCGAFHGICFAKEWHGKGVARVAVSKVIDEVFASRQQKISASFFEGNIRVYRFLLGLGFKSEGVLKAQTLQGGKPVDVRMTALFKEDWLCRSSAS